MAHTWKPGAPTISRTPWSRMMRQPEPIDRNRPTPWDNDLHLDRRAATALASPRQPTTARFNGAPRVSLTPAMRSTLVRMRQRAGLTGDQAANLIGRTQSFIAHVELG